MSRGTAAPSFALRMLDNCRPGPPPSPRLILVEDDGALRNALTFAFETEGYAVSAYGDAAGLLHGPHLMEAVCLILDEKLPGPSGLDLLEWVRAEGATMPAVLITTHPSDAVRRRALTACASIVEKPLWGDALSRKVRELIQAS